MYIPNFKNSQVLFSLFELIQSLWNDNGIYGSTPGVGLPVINAEANPTKSIAIVGAGTGGLAAIKAFVDLPEDVRADWEIVVYDQRRDYGGVWLPDSHPYYPPSIPETPLYPLLHTNIPAPLMTYPQTPYPPYTSLYPSHEHVQRYHATYARENALDDYVHFNHSIESAEWVGDEDDGKWNIIIRVEDEGARGTVQGEGSDRKPYEFRKTFDHLILATGHFHVPHIVHFQGQEEWLAADSDRTIIHSVWYRDPKEYANRSVLIVGARESARDIGSQVVSYANEVYQSIHHNDSKYNLLLPPPVIPKPGISFLNSTSVVFADGSAVHDSIDTVILGTGYELRVPFLERTGEMYFDPHASDQDEDDAILTTNGNYIRPLHQHIFSLASRHPSTALAFIGLPSLAAYGTTTTAQARYVAAAIASESSKCNAFLPSREDMLANLAEHEAYIRGLGLDPYVLGHKMLDPFEYQDDIMERVYQHQHQHPNSSHPHAPFTEPWRRKPHPYLERGWKRVESLGEDAMRAWLEGVESEEEWADLFDLVNAWQEEWEMEHGLVFEQAWKSQ